MNMSLFQLYKKKRLIDLLPNKLRILDSKSQVDRYEII